MIYTTGVRRPDNWDAGAWAWKNSRTRDRLSHQETHVDGDAIVAGTSTSGCVRATVVEAFSHNYRVAVVEEGCFDRAQASHAMTLCDLQAKYADVVKLDDIIAFIATLPQGLFELPPA